MGFIDWSERSSPPERAPHSSVLIIDNDGCSASAMLARTRGRKRHQSIHVDIPLQRHQAPQPLVHTSKQSRCLAVSKSIEHYSDD